MSARAVLEIDASTSGLQRAFGVVRNDARSTSAFVAKEFTGRAATAFRTTAKVMVDTSKGASQAIVRDAQRTVVDYVRGETQKRRAAELTAAKRVEAEKKASEIARDEARKRGLTAEQETKVRVHAMQTLTQRYEVEERKRSVIARREQRARDQDSGRRGRLVGTIGSTVAGSARDVARSAHEVIQGARQRSAGIESSLNATFFQAGVGGREGASMRAALQRETANGRLRGLSMEDVSAALGGAQSQFSVLSGRTESERGTNLEEQIRLMSFARDTYQRPEEVLRVGGMLGQQGIRGAQRDAMLRALTGLGQSGSVELSDVVSSGLGPLMQNVAVATGRLGAGATDAQRSQAVQAATARAVSVSEVAGRGGMSVTDSLNALRKADTAMTDTRTAANLRAGLHSRGFTDAQIGTVLTRERDARSGHMVDRFRSTDSLSTLTTLSGMFGGNTADLTNMLRGGGHGTPQVFDRQVQRLVGVLSSQSGGSTISNTVGALQREGMQFGDDSVARGRAMRDAEVSTALAVEQEKNTVAVAENTTGVRDLSNAIRSWQASNPLTAGALPVVGGAAATALGGSKGVVAALGAATVNSLATGLTGRTAGGDHLGVFDRVTRIQNAAGGLANPFNVLNAGQDAYSAATGRHIDITPASVQALVTGLAEAITRNPLTVTPHAATVAAGNADATRGQTPRPADR